MARVPTVDPSDFDARLVEILGERRSDERVALGALPAWAVQPDAASAMVQFQRALESGTSLSTRLRELVRLRVAFHNRCRSCMAVRSAGAISDGMTEAAVCSLERPEEADDLTEAEKAALAYADLMATDHLAVSDEHFERLRASFTDAQIVELGAHIGLCVGFGRLAATWDLVDHLSDDLLADDAAPWATTFTLR